MGLIGHLLGRARKDWAPEVLAAVDRAVDRVEPRLRQASGYPYRYARAVAHALEYSRALADQVPGPVMVSRAAFAGDPLVHALFATPEDIHAALCLSRGMHQFRAGHPEAGDVYALLCMRRDTRSLLGVEMDGEMLRRDVIQQAVNFSNHTVADAGETEAEARERIAEGFFDSLLARVASRIEDRRRERENLERQKDELLGRLRCAGEDKRDGLNARLRETLEALGRLAESSGLARYAEEFDAVLLEPEKFLYLERSTMILDGMGLLRDRAGGDSEELEFCDLVGRDRRRWTVVLMHCNQVMEEAARDERMVLAERWLGL